MKSVGVTVADQGAGIVSVERSPFIGPLPKGIDGPDHILATDIQRLPFDVSAVAKRLREMDEPDTAFHIDADGLGAALWTVLDGPSNPQHWQLYSGRGLERQSLVDELVVVIEQGRFHFAPRLVEQDAMSKGLVGYRRQVKEDGLIGSELVVALLLAIRPLPVKAWFAYA